MERSFTGHIQEGDIITAYRKGIHIVTKVERRFYTEYDQRYTARELVIGEEYSGLIYYRQIAKADGTEMKGKKIWTCDAAYCRVIDDNWFRDKFDDLERKRQAIEDLRRRLSDA